MKIIEQIEKHILYIISQSNYVRERQVSIFSNSPIYYKAPYIKVGSIYSMPWNFGDHNGIIAHIMIEIIGMPMTELNFQSENKILPIMLSLIESLKAPEHLETLQISATETLTYDPQKMQILWNRVYESRLNHKAIEKGEICLSVHAFNSA